MSGCAGTPPVRDHRVPTTGSERNRLSASPYAQESSEGHSYTRPADLGVTRARLARSLRAHRGTRSTRLRTGLASTRVESVILTIGDGLTLIRKR